MKAISSLPEPGVPDIPVPPDPTIPPPQSPDVPPVPGIEIPPSPDVDPLGIPTPIEEPPLDPGSPDDPSQPMIA